MTTAAALVKEGGTVVYSVCTVTGEECEEVARFAEEMLGLVKVGASPMVGRGGLDAEKLTQRFDPELDGAGYLLAKSENSRQAGKLPCGKGFPEDRPKKMVSCPNFPLLPLER